jgi:hypothetical protein
MSTALLMLLGICSVVPAVRCFRQHVALLEIERIGASIGIERPPPHWLQRLIGGAHARGFANGFTVLCSPGFADADLAYMKEIPTLEFLRLEETRVTDVGLLHLSALRTLRRLDLSGTCVTDAGLSLLVGLTMLNELNLRSTGVSDAGVAELQRIFPKLKIMR